MRDVAAKAESKVRRRILLALAFGLFVCAAFIAVPAAGWMFFNTARIEERQPSTVAIPEKGLVVLEPNDWIGGRFPLLKHIEIDTDLAAGHWKVLLVQPDCADCRGAVRDLADEMRRSGPSAVRWAVVSLSSGPLPEDFGRLNAACRVGRLDAHHDWFAQTPLEIEIDNAVVESARQL
jgi:hypothetical protein